MENKYLGVEVGQTMSSINQRINTLINGKWNATILRNMDTCEWMLA